MKTTSIPLDSLKLQNGGRLRIDKQQLIVSSGRVLDKNGTRIRIPDKLNLPFRIDVTMKTNSSDFSFIVGKGGVAFSGFINQSGGGIRRTDIVTGKSESVKHEFGNDVPLDEYMNLSVIYGNKITWIELNDVVCYPSAKTPYVKLLQDNALSNGFSDGFGFAIGCGKNVELMIKSLSITQYEHDEFELPLCLTNFTEPSSFDWFIKSLPHYLHNETIMIDKFLLHDMKKSMRFTRSTDKYGNVSYNSPCNFQVKLRKYTSDSGVNIDEHGSGAIQTNWNADRIPDVLRELEKLSTEFADKTFSRMQVCNTPSCKAGNSTIVYNNETKKTCGGNMKFIWQASEFEDMRKIVTAVCEIL